MDNKLIIHEPFPGLRSELPQEEEGGHALRHLRLRGLPGDGPTVGRGRRDGGQPGLGRGHAQQDSGRAEDDDDVGDIGDDADDDDDGGEHLLRARLQSRVRSARRREPGTTPFSESI